MMTSKPPPDNETSPTPRNGPTLPIIKSHRAVFPKNIFTAIRHNKPNASASQTVVESAKLAVADNYKRFATRPEGLTAVEARKRIAEHGPNVLAKDQRIGIATLIWHAVLNPLESLSKRIQHK
jgi:hypothetical protein